MDIIKSTKENNKIPASAEIIKKDKTVRVEEIENGFLVITSYNIEYKDGDRHDWAYQTTKHYSKEDPLEIKTNDKELADLFNVE